MQIPQQQARALAEAGLQALRRSDAAAARAAFEQLAAGGAADADAHLGLAYACAALRDMAAAHAAVDAALASAPRHLRALLLKADLLHAAGDRGGAVGFYQAAVRAVPEGAVLPAELQQEVARAQAACAQLAGQFEQTLRASLPPAASARFAQSLDILFGHRQIYLQQPRHYYFPELPQIQFHDDRAAFPWLEALESATADIRAELLAVMAGPAGGADAFVPYVQRSAQRPSLQADGLVDNPDWSAFYLWKDGQPVAAHAARCPRTMAALAQVPLATLAGRSPAALFSQLRAGAHIPPHHGFVNTRLIVHLPLLVPPGCRFRVGNDTREWVEGRAWVFDDTIEHEAWNDSVQTRVVLLFEVWRPELTAAERSQVSTMFEAIDRERGGGAAWGL